METTTPHPHRVKLIAMGVFTLVTLMLAIIVQVTDAQSPSPWEWTLLMLATFGMARIITTEKVALPMREALEGTPLEEIITCPRCTGMWVAIGLLAMTMLWPSAGMVFLILFSLAGVNIFVQQVLRLTEHLSAMCYSLSTICEEKAAPKPDLDAFNRQFMNGNSDIHTTPIKKD